MPKIEVKGVYREKAYEIIIENGLLGRIKEFLRPGQSVVIVTDRNIDMLFLQEMDLPKIVLESGEASKTMETVTKLLESFAHDYHLHRNACVICVGGGVIGDIGGFAASIYMRGIDYMQVPTTLVGMVDSSIGGKTGVDLGAGKNLAGAFYNPAKILIDPSLIERLPEKEVKNGLGEMVKHAILADPGLLDLLKSDPKSEMAIMRALQVKVDIVSEDQFEEGRRSWLNLGHSLAHAYEKLSDYAIPHGMAVAKGIYKESQIAEKLGVLPDFSQIEAALSSLGLDYSPFECDLEKLWEALLVDKKNTESNKVAFAFSRGMGAGCEVRNLTKEEFIKLYND